jgi:hypothetical protein
LSSCEFIFIDHTSAFGSTNHNEGQQQGQPPHQLDLIELREFLSFLQQAFNLDIKFIQSSDLLASSKSSHENSGNGGNGGGSVSYLDFIQAAVNVAKGQYLMFLEADNIIQPKSLLALRHTFESHPQVFGNKKSIY